MSKGNLFLGFGRGKVGDVVLYRAYGEQIARARNRSPRNPQSPLQLLQRVIMKTVSTAYSLTQEITDHSFQGYGEGTPNQSRFNRLNVAKLRESLADLINSGDEQRILSSDAFNFSFKFSSLAAMNPYIVSEGTLQTINVAWNSQLATPAFVIQVNIGSADPTYADVVRALNLHQGDQLTFLALSCDDTIDTGSFNGFEFSRVILEPSDGDMTSPFMNNGEINKPNDRNRGAVAYSIVNQGDNYYLSFVPENMVNAATNDRSIAAAAVIVSRLVGDVWARSSQSLVLRPQDTSQLGHLTFDHTIDLLGDAIQSYMTGESSTLYLNSANF